MEISACTFLSSFYLMYFVFISDVYLYNVLHFILNKSNPPNKEECKYARTIYLFHKHLPRIH